MEFRKFNKICIPLEFILLASAMITEQYALLVPFMTLLCLLRLLFKVGDGSFFLEILYMHTNLTCVFMPWIGYRFYTSSDMLARLWVRYMPIDEKAFFGYVLPATVLFGWSLFMFRNSSQDGARVINPVMQKLKQVLQTIPVNSIFLLIGVSVVSYSVTEYLPEALNQLNTFLYYCLFTGICYLYFHNKIKNRWIYLVVAIGFIVFDALRTGMFTLIVYMNLIFLVLFLSGKKISNILKLLALVSGIFLIIFLQLFKVTWRQNKWYASSTVETKDLSVDEAVAISVKKFSDNNLSDAMFPIYYRMNQGFNVALVQKRIPEKVNYFGGEYLVLSFVSAFVPRVFWPDKPKAGGQYNMETYAGYSLRGWSTNIGPIGEAYGNFGVIGGWIYMMFFGFFLRISYTTFLKICKRNAIFFIWMPVLFFQIIYVMETDSLQAFNSLMKGAFFIWLLYKLFPALFGKRVLSKKHELILPEAMA